MINAKNTLAYLLLLVGLTGLALLPRNANAIPTLQLGISGGVYNFSTETIVSTSPTFSLYAFLIPDADNLLTDTYFLSMAVTPKTSSPASLGSFTYDSNTVNVTSDMTYGNPPVDSFFPDIGGHGIYDTYYKEVAFTFSNTNQSAAFNTQDYPAWGPQSGSGMYYRLFNIDTTNLAAGNAIHFDLYNTNLKETCKQGLCTTSALTTQKAPFSHDAQSMTSVVTPVPEPETYVMLLAGLGLLGFSARRRNKHIFN